MATENKTLKPRRLMETLMAWLHQWWLLIIPVTLACMAVGAYIFAFHAWPTHEVPAAWGTFGDFVGGLLNPVVSTLTLFVAIQVWHLQRKELEETKKVLEEQAQTAAQQRDGQRFFDFLSIYLRTLESLTWQGSNGHSTGKAAIHEWVNDRLSRNTGTQLANFYNQLGLLNALEKTLPSDWNEPPPELRQNWGSESIFFHPYFRTVFRLLDDADVLFKVDDDKYRFMKLFRAQLSNEELNLLALNVLLSNTPKVLSTTAKFGLLKHLPNGHVRTTLEKNTNFPKEIFGRKFVNQERKVQQKKSPC